MILACKPYQTRLLAAVCRVCLACLVAALAGCSGMPTVPTPTPTLATATQTPTIVWFPATNTPTQAPVVSPLPSAEPLPGVAELMFRDDFSDAALWNVSVSDSASAQVADNRLTLALSTGPQSIASLRSEPLLTDFYAQVRVYTSLCRGNDQYGMLFRASPGGTYYRFLLACNGSIRLERVRGGAVDILQNWVPSGDAPPGAPAELKIGIWVSGTEFRFLLNDRFQFSLRDPVMHSGTLGFFAYASGKTPVMVSFSDLEVFVMAYVSPTPTQTPTSTPTP
jgi:hypothetical protein